MNNNFREETYRSPKTLSHFVLALFGGIGICTVLYIIFSLIALAAPDAKMDLGPDGQIHFAFVVIALISILEILLRIAVIVMFLIWLYRAYANLSPLKAYNLDYTPGWAVGWWFIPFVNLVMPYKIVREVWNESDPDIDFESPFSNIKGGAPSFLILWWLLFLASNFAGRVVSGMIDRETGSAGFSDTVTVALIVSSVLQLGAVILAMQVVWGITKRQDARFQKVGLPAYSVPPPPTNFV